MDPFQAEAAFVLSLNYRGNGHLVFMPRFGLGPRDLTGPEEVHSVFNHHN